MSSYPSRVIGVAMNSRNVSQQRAAEERKRAKAKLGVPVCDVFLHGPQALTDAILEIKAESKTAMTPKKLPQVPATLGVTAH